MILKNRNTWDERAFTLRPFRTEDAPQIIACITDAYGATYVKPYLYTEQGVLEHEASGALRFSVAETDDGRIAGITAYERSEHFNGLVEIACQVIVRSCNGYGLALPLALHTMRRAEKLPDTTGLFARALGCHLISQKTLKGMGFTACGFLLNVFDKERFRYHFQNGNYAKIPQSVAVKRCGAEREARVWLPEELRPLGTETLNALGCRPVFFDDAQPPTGEGVWAAENDERHATLALWNRRCGADFSARLEGFIVPVAERPGQTVNLYLNISTDGCAEAYRLARMRGFIFTGFLPCAADGVYMILHHPLRVPVPLDGIPYIPEYSPFVEQIRRQLCERT